MKTLIALLLISTPALADYQTGSCLPTETLMACVARPKAPPPPAPKYTGVPKVPAFRLAPPAEGTLSYDARLPPVPKSVRRPMPLAPFPFPVRQKRIFI